MSKERFMLRWSLVSLVSFVVALRIVSLDYIMRDDLAIDSSLSIFVRMIKIIQQIFQKEHCSDLLKHFRRQVRCIESVLFFEQSANVLFETYSGA